MNKNKILISVIIFTLLIIFLVLVLNPTHKYNNLVASEDKWNSIQESRIENKNLILEDIRFNDYKLIIDEKNDTLYYSLINDNRNKYNPKVEYKANGENIELVILSDDITDEKVKNNCQFKIMIYNENEYHTYNLKYTDFPILNIIYNQNQEINQKNIPMEMYLFDNLSNIPNKITISRGKFKMNEGIYIFSLHMLTPGKNKRENRVSILGMNPNSEYILTKVEDLQIQEDGMNPENKRHKVELFLNNEYVGQYYLEYENKPKKNANMQ